MTNITGSQSVSCPLCGARSSVKVPLVVPPARTWTHACPVCERPWTVSVFSRRGVPAISVEAQLATRAKTKARGAPKKAPRSKPAAGKKARRKAR
jgi:hypothetical protein